MRDMKERYRLRHPSLQGTLGPYTIEELHKAVEANSFPVDSRVLPVDAADESANWRALHELLGLPAPPSGAPLPRAASAAPVTTAGDRRRALRAATAYGGLRTLIHVITGVALVAVLLIFAMTKQSHLGFELLLMSALEAAVIVIVAGALQALLDIADCSLQRGARDDG